jgi:hypothetical protein
MRSMTQSHYLRRGISEALLPLQIKATKRPLDDEIDACLIVAITEVIVGYMILTENHLISPPP